MQVKAPSRKEEVLSEYDPETLPSSLGQKPNLNGLLQSGFKVRSVKILIGNHGRCVLYTKEVRDLVVCHQVSQFCISDGIGCISIYGLGILPIWKVIINA